jgi:hypothetical protein
MGRVSNGEVHDLSNDYLFAFIGCGYFTIKAKEKKTKDITPHNCTINIRSRKYNRQSTRN